MTKTIAFLLLFPLQAFSWGYFGHELTGEIASQHLTSRTAQAIKKISRGKSLRNISVWADRQRSNRKWRFLAPYHYVSIPDDEHYDPQKSNRQGDVIQGIELSIDILKGRARHRSINEFEALALIVHFVADLHQPLHAGRSEDRGGNSLRVEWMGRRSNLHKVWDTEMLRSSRKNQSQIIKEATRNFPVQRSWFGKTASDWAFESVRLRDQVYTFDGFFFEPQFLAQFSGHHNHRVSFFNSENDSGHSHNDIDWCGSDLRPEAEEFFSIHLGDDYFDKNWMVTQKRLVQAGVRIAEVLNQIFDSRR